MTEGELISKIFKELEQLPFEKLQELYAVIQKFKDDTEGNVKDDIISFAGCWDDMSDSEFEEFINEVYDRRKSAFSDRDER